MPFDDVVKELIDGPLKLSEEEARALEGKLDSVKSGLQKVLDSLTGEDGQNKTDADNFFKEETKMAERLVAIGGDDIAVIAKKIDAATGKTLSELVQAFMDAVSKL